MHNINLKRKILFICLCLINSLNFQRVIAAKTLTATRVNQNFTNVIRNRNDAENGPSTSL